jgi:hypothetical protein
MIIIVECKLETDVSTRLSTFLLGLLASTLSVYIIATIVQSIYVIINIFTRRNAPPNAALNNHISSAPSESNSEPVGLTANPCGYHAPILAGELRKSRGGMSPMERFLDETSSQANALFTRADNWKSSFDKGCNCELGSGILSISADE